MCMLDKEMINFSEGTEHGDWRFHYAIHNSAQFKTQDLFFWNFPFNIFRTAGDSR